MGKWCIHLGQTFSFSSSSLSKIIVLHLGHFVHRPSGMSRFLDLALDEPSLGLGRGGTFSGGGVKAGSTISVPPNFFTKTVVPILFGFFKNISQAARHCPHTNVAGARRPQRPGTLVGG